MKKLFLIVLAFAFVQSQAQVLNNSFENWADRTYDFDGFGGFYPADTINSLEPLNWTTVNALSGADTFGGRLLVNRAAISSSGAWSMQLRGDTLNTTETPVGPRRMTFPGIAFNGTFNLDMQGLILTGGMILPEAMPGAGQPFTQRLATFKGYYNYHPVFNDSIHTMDSCYITAILRKGDSLVARAVFKSDITTVGFVPFAVPFDYFSCELPDTLVVEIASSIPNMGSILTGATTIVPGSVLQVDNLSYDLLQSTNCPLNFSVGLGSDRNACHGSRVILNPQVSGGHPPYSYSWSVTGNALSCGDCKNPMVTVTQNSQFRLTVTDANNQQVSDTIFYSEIGNNNTLSLSVTNTGIDCGHPEDTTTVSVTGGTAPYSFGFGFSSPFVGSSPQSQNFTQAGTYVIAVTDAASCIASVLDTVVSNGLLITSTQMVNPTCVGQNTGKIKVAVTQGTSPYSYLWNNGITADSITSVHATTYMVTVTDATQCTSSAYYSLSPMDGWGFSVFLLPSTSNCNNHGTVTAVVNSGSSPYAYNWSNGSTTQNLTSISSGTYTLTVTDALGCTTIGNALLTTSCYSFIKGHVFDDLNGNCIFEAGEGGIGNIYVTATRTGGPSYYAYVDGSGNYEIRVNSTGTYTLSANHSFSSSCGNLVLCGGSVTATITVDGDTASNNNFGFSGVSGFDFDVHPGWSPANPGFEKDYWILVYNFSPVSPANNGEVTFNYDPNLVYQHSSPTATHDLLNHTLTWNVNPNQLDWANRLHCNFRVPVTLSLNTPLHSAFHIEPTLGDCDISNNSLIISEVVTGSHDPNEKKVEPAGRILEEDSVLTYTIGFQNTGTDSTHFIIIKDTLSPNLDPASVRNIASSHPYSEFAVSGRGILTWTFNPLRLVDSFTNEPGSHGFVMFTVKKKFNMPIGSVISNTAHIYFDYNAAVVTNTVADTISEPNSIFQMRSTDGISVKAYPNPFTRATNIVVDGLTGKFDFELYDVTGRLERRLPGIENNQFILNRDNMPTGVYFFKILSADKKRSGFGKLMVE